MGECGLAGEGIDVDTSHEQGALAADQRLRSLLAVLDPDDGAGCVSRTPVIRFTAAPARSAAEYPAVGPRTVGRRCVRFSLC